MGLHDLFNVRLGEGHTIAHNQARAKPSRLAAHTSFRPAEVLGYLFGAVDGWQGHVWFDYGSAGVFANSSNTSA